MGFFGKVAKEMKIVHWPSGKDLVKYTIIVITTVILAAIFIGLSDYGINELFRWIISLV